MALNLLTFQGSRLSVGEGILVLREMPDAVPDPTPDEEVMSTDPPQVTATAAGANAILVDWTEILYAVKYEVWEAATTSGPVAVVLPPFTERTASPLAADGRTYTYRVRAQAADGTYGEFGYAAPLVLGTAPDPGTTPDPTLPPVIEPDLTITEVGSRSNTGVVGIGNPTRTPMAAGTYSQNNLTIKNRTINGDLIVTGSNVVITGCVITGQVKIRIGSNIWFQDSDCAGFIIDGAKNVGVRRIYSTGQLGSDGSQIKSDGYPGCENVLVEQCWIGGPVITDSSHYDGTQVRGCNHLRFRWVHWDQGSTFNDNLNASLFSQDANGGNDDVLVEHCWSRHAGHYHFRMYGTNQRLEHITFFNKHLQASHVHSPLISNSTPLTIVDCKWEDGTTAIPDTP